jgi:hypothetical protein
VRSIRAAHTCWRGANREPGRVRAGSGRSTQRSFGPRHDSNASHRETEPNGGSARESGAGLIAESNVDLGDHAASLPTLHGRGPVLAPRAGRRFGASLGLDLPYAIEVVLSVGQGHDAIPWSGHDHLHLYRATDRPRPGRLTVRQPLSYQGRCLAPLYYREEGSPCAAGGKAVVQASMRRWRRGRGAELSGGDALCRARGGFYATTPWNGLPRGLLRLTRPAQVQHRRHSGDPSKGA